MRRPRLASTALALLLAAGCSGVDGRVGPSTDPPSPRPPGGLDLALASLRTVDDCDVLLRELKDAAIARVGPYGLADGFGGAEDVLAEGGVRRAAPGVESDTAAPPASAARGMDGGDAGTFSGTNAQEVGVDEPDVVKTDGDSLFAVTGTDLVAVEADGTAGLLDRLDLSGADRDTGFDRHVIEGVELLLAGDRLLALTSTRSSDEPDTGDSNSSMSSRGGMPITRLTSIDVSDPADLRITDVVTVEGHHRTARMVDGTARIVLDWPGPQLAWRYPQSWTDEAESRAANRALIEATTLDDWLPQRVDGGRTDRLVGCDDVYLPASFAGTGLVTVLTAPLAGIGPIEPRAASLAATADTVYASATGLYVASHAWVAPPTTSDFGAGPDMAPAPPGDVFTDLHRFDITGEVAVHTASGRVEGTVLNQYALSEHEGRLRVATTSSNWSAARGSVSASSSAVTVFEARGPTLVPVGSVGDLGRGETIRSVRYVGDTAYVVTFRQTDPFYVVDLADPTAPRVVGELKLPGYSGYLHPIDATHVLGVGQEGDADGTITGVKVSLFDVSDPAHPAETSNWVEPGGSQSVEWDARTFLWWPATRLAVMPIGAWGDGRQPVFAGAVGLTVDATGVRELGRVTQPGTASIGVGPIERSVVVGDTLWTLSSAGLLPSDLATLAPGSFVAFP